MYKCMKIGKKNLSLDMKTNVSYPTSRTTIQPDNPNTKILARKTDRHFGFPAFDIFPLSALKLSSFANGQSQLWGLPEL